MARTFRKLAQYPFTGSGKPEPLVGLGSGFWLRRLNQEHRLVYRIEN